jgi:hypothetical protein
MATRKGKKIKVQDLKPKKDAKGGFILNPVHQKPLNNPSGHNAGGNKPLNNPSLNIGGH